MGGCKAVLYNSLYCPCAWTYEECGHRHQAPSKWMLLHTHTQTHTHAPWLAAHAVVSFDSALRGLTWAATWSDQTECSPLPLYSTSVLFLCSPTPWHTSVVYTSGVSRLKRRSHPFGKTYVKSQSSQAFRPDDSPTAPCSNCLPKSTTFPFILSVGAQKTPNAYSSGLCVV